MNQYKAQLPANAAEQLCAMALRAGSEDDISVLVIETSSPSLSSSRVFTPWIVFATLVVLICAALGWARVSGLL